MGNNDCGVKKSQNMIMSHKTDYADAVGVAFKYE